MRRCKRSFKPTADQVKYEKEPLRTADAVKFALVKAVLAVAPAPSSAAVNDAAPTSRSGTPVREAIPEYSGQWPPAPVLATSAFEVKGKPAIAAAPTAEPADVKLMVKKQVTRFPTLI